LIRCLLIDWLMIKNDRVQVKSIQHMSPEEIRKARLAFHGQGADSTTGNDIDFQNLYSSIAVFQLMLTRCKMQSNQ
jgi:hypothetical protein